MFASQGRWEFYGRGQPMYARAADGGPGVTAVAGMFLNNCVLGVDILGAEKKS